MAFKLNGTGSNVTKVYLQPVSDAAAPGSRQYEYVTTDTAATVAGNDYISTSTADGQVAYDMLQTGDLIWSFQVTALDDTQPISDDKGDGLTAVSLHCVLVKDSDGLNLSDDLLVATVTGES